MSCREFEEFASTLEALPKPEWEKKIKEYLESKDVPWGGHCEDCWNKYHNGLKDKDYDAALDPFKGGKKKYHDGGEKCQTGKHT